MSLETRVTQLEDEVAELKRIIQSICRVDVCDLCHKMMDPTSKCRGCKTSYCPTCDPFYNEHYLEGYCTIKCARAHWIGMCCYRTGYDPEQKIVDRITALLDQTEADMVSDRV
jgi:hypothetical protein